MDLSNLPPPEEVLRLLDRADAEEDLYTFLRMAWQHFDPAPWTDGWPIEAISEHLTAVCDGQIKRLIINIPPRCSKSSLVSVAFPAWVWAQSRKSYTSGPGVKFLCASHALNLAERDSGKCRDLIKSKWYQSLWGDRFQIKKDSDSKSRYANDVGGERLIRSITAGATGEGGDIILIDDPNDASDERSEVTREGVIEWWSGTMSSRLNNRDHGAFIIIQQRIAEDDLSGHILEKNADGWDHLVLPMRYESDRSFSTSIGWKDPRETEGELLWPERFSMAAVKDQEREWGPWRTAGQFQQRPEPAGGGIIKREWWQPWLATEYPVMDYILASVDTAYTEKTSNDPSALTIWGVFSEAPETRMTRLVDANGEITTARLDANEHAPKVMLMYAWAERLEFHNLVEKIARDCKRFRVDKLLIEAKASGISVAQEMRRVHANDGFGVQLINPGALDKVARLYSVQHIFADGTIFAPDKEWAETVFKQIGQFPKGRHDDLVDSTSMAIRHLRDIGMLTRAPEREAELESGLRFRGRDDKVALYPA